MQSWIDSSAYGETAKVHKNHREIARRLHATQPKVKALPPIHVLLAGKGMFDSLYMQGLFATVRRKTVEVGRARRGGVK